MGHFFTFNTDSYHRPCILYILARQMLNHFNYNLKLAIWSRFWDFSLSINNKLHYKLHVLWESQGFTQENKHKSSIFFKSWKASMSEFSDRKLLFCYVSLCLVCGPPNTGKTWLKGIKYKLTILKNVCCLVSLVKTKYLRLSIFVYSLQNTIYIYIQNFINGNKMDFYNNLVQLKQKLHIETIICIDEGNPSKFEQFEFILDNI